ncbi:hypothetical protein QA640_39255 [Bradyrhizobium sp. CB82]|uniref:hypothetical protein n=1 Tax=Bradyrhizobium sp. CB82 TaxID=3039159 RepID=UPI0024B1E41D|nr:hypothetical protein [Bradyrhizobium sp. CB82]WFU40180.1 hypothetical protein QA640_39255 [Bradyrhizobium sp. CB82]
MNDEDWGQLKYPLSYMNTISGQANGRFTYYTADAGYDLLRAANYKIGGFIGWTYYETELRLEGMCRDRQPEDEMLVAP